MNSEIRKNEAREPDIYALLIVLWNNKAMYSLFIVISLIISMLIVYTARTIYTAEAVIHVKVDPSSEMIEQETNLRLNTLNVPGMTRVKETSSIIPKILGREFLNKISKNQDLSEIIKKSCTYSSPGILSATGMFDFIGIYKLKAPTAKQINENFVDCLRNMIEIKEYKYGDIKTPAHKISIFHGNPNFAAQLGNAIVDQFFLEDTQRARLTFEKSMKYLSETVAKAGKDLTLANQKLESFLLETPTYSTFKNTKGGLAQDFSMYNEKLSGWASLLDKKEELKRTISRLENITKEKYFDKNQILETFRLGTTSDYSNLSRGFISEITKLENTTSLSVEIKSKIALLVKQEIERLKQAYISVSNLLEEEREEVEKVLKLNEELSALKYDVASKEIYYDGLVNTVQQKNLTFGQVALKENKLYSRATPPIEPTSPDIKGIVIVSLILGLLSATIFILVRQLFVQKIYSESQLDNIDNLKNKVVTLQTKDLKLKNLISGNMKKSAVSKGNTISRLIDNGSKGCFIEVDSKERYRGIADLVSLFFANLALKSDNNVVCLNSNVQVPDQSFEGNIDRVIMDTNITKDDLIKGKIVISRQKSYAQEGNTLPTIDHQIRKYGKIFLNINKNNSALSELNLISECDFFILIGKVGKCTEGNLRQYISNLGIEHEKFAGLVLVR